MLEALSTIESAPRVGNALTKDPGLDNVVWRISKVCGQQREAPAERGAPVFNRMKTVGQRERSNGARDRVLGGRKTVELCYSQ